MTDAIPISSAKLDELLEQRRKDFERIAQLESALQLIGNELSLHADKGPAGEAFRALLNPTFGFPLESEGGK